MSLCGCLSVLLGGGCASCLFSALNLSSNKAVENCITSTNIVVIVLRVSPTNFRISGETDNQMVTESESGGERRVVGSISLWSSDLSPSRPLIEWMHDSSKGWGR